MNDLEQNHFRGRFLFKFFLAYGRFVGGRPFW